MQSQSQSKFISLWLNQRTLHSIRVYFVLGSLLVCLLVRMLYKGFASSLGDREGNNPLHQ